MGEAKDAGMGQVIRIDEGRNRDHLGEMVHGALEEARNATLEAEADRLCGEGQYERTEGRRDTRAGSQWSARKYMNMAPLYAEQASTHEAVA